MGSLRDTGFRKTFLALRPLEQIGLGLVLAGALGALGFWLGSVYLAATKEVPKAGGEYIEGIVAQPRYVNPILSQTSDADADLARLTYCSLFDYDREGALRPYAASGYQVSEDGKVYTVSLRSGVLFHDEVELTADDVVYTVQMIQDPATKSPLRANWIGVDVRAVDRYTVEFSVKKPYFGFLDKLAVGILPKHRWQEISPDNVLLADYNVEPIGCGPYRYFNAEKDSGGRFLSFELRAFEKYFRGVPFVSKLSFHFYPDEGELIDAFLRKEVMGMQSVTAENVSRIVERKSANVHEMDFPRLYGVFFNITKSVPLAYSEVREALNYGTDREALVESVLGGHGSVAAGPFLPFMPAYAADLSWPMFDLDRANRLLDEKGWVRNADGIRGKDGTVLAIKLAVPDWPDLIRTAELLKAQWAEIGVTLELSVMSPNDLSQNVIRPREYEALLFGEQSLIDEDPFSFWHSSNKKDSGLNFSLFDDKEADELLLAAREELDPASRYEKYRQFQEIYLSEWPALPLYTSDYLHVTDATVRGMEVEKINAPSDRFADIHEWYVKTTRVKK